MIRAPKDLQVHIWIDEQRLLERRFAIRKFSTCAITSSR